MLEALLPNVTVIPSFSQPIQAIPINSYSYPQYEQADDHAFPLSMNTCPLGIPKMEEGQHQQGPFMIPHSTHNPGVSPMDVSRSASFVYEYESLMPSVSDQFGNVEQMQHPFIMLDSYNINGEDLPSLFPVHMGQHSNDRPQGNIPGFSMSIQTDLPLSMGMNVNEGDWEERIHQQLNLQ